MNLKTSKESKATGAPLVSLQPKRYYHKIDIKTMILEAQEAIINGVRLASWCTATTNHLLPPHA
jgi:hypothetical protein